jgi:hypothetical protein
MNRARENRHGRARVGDVDVGVRGSHSHGFGFSSDRWDAVASVVYVWMEMKRRVGAAMMR